MSTKGPSQGRGALQKGRARWPRKLRARAQDDAELPRRPPSAKKRRHDELRGDEPAEPAAPAAPREVVNRAVTTAPPFRFVAQIGQGTYGKVYKAVDVTTRTVLAMKRLRLESQREGLPVTAAREIKLLQTLAHRNIVRLNEIVVARNDIYMALDYIEHDLAGLLLNPRLTIAPAHVKSVIAQTTAALAFLHARRIMHRDIKGSNILVTAEGVVKLADFGLARAVDVARPDARYTNRVITLWYRPPELLLGADRYGPEVDTWGVGCLLVELFLRGPLFHGKDEISQLQAIYDVLGVPPAADWPAREQLPWFTLFDSLPMVDPQHPRTVPGVLSDAHVPPDAVSPACIDLVARLLTFNPAHRLGAADALDHAYFAEDPPPEPLQLALVDEWHDWEAKQRTRTGACAKELGPEPEPELEPVAQFADSRQIDKPPTQQTPSQKKTPKQTQKEPMPPQKQPQKPPQRPPQKQKPPQKLPQRHKLPRKLPPKPLPKPPHGDTRKDSAKPQRESQTASHSQTSQAEPPQKGVVHKDQLQYPRPRTHDYRKRPGA